MPMTLHFPNASRCYDAARRAVSFWGHDSAFEIVFHVEEEALRRLSPNMAGDEASLLRSFDTNRARIERVAGNAYQRRRRCDHHRLSAADF